MPDPAGERRELLERQVGMRRELRVLLGIPVSPGELRAEARGSLELGELVVEKWILRSEPGSRMPALVYRPAERGPARPGVVLAFGHGASKSHPTYSYLGQLLARLGMLVLAADPIGEEERHRRGRGRTRAHDAPEVDAAAWRAGRPILGKLVFDTMRGVDYLLTRDDVDPRRIAVVGHSLGGAVAGWMAALDTRVRASVSSGWAYAPALEERGKSCTRLPNQQLRRRLEWHEYLSLGAPHGALLVANGDADVVIDHAGDGRIWRDTDAAVRAAARTWRDLGAPDRIATWYQAGGGHRPYPAHPEVLAWLVGQLEPSGWTPERVRGLPRIGYGDWARQRGAPLEAFYATTLHLLGATLVDLDLPYPQPQQLAVLEPAEVGRPEFTLEGWLATLAGSP